MRYFGAVWLGVQRLPLNDRICPSKFVAMQKCVVAHETLSNRSSCVLVVVILYGFHEWPLNVIRALGFPGTPLAPAAVQNVGVGHETL
jgi:hypothetical protein